jgi:Putative porin
MFKYRGYRGNLFKNKADADWRAIGGALSLCALTCVSPVMGQPAADSEAKRTDARKSLVSNARPTSPNATVNLLNLMVQKGLLKQEEADALIKQAENEAYVARQAAKDASTKADEAAKAASAATTAAQPPGTRHVTYVPEIVKQQLRDEIKQQVFAKASKENWASPGAYPEWAQRIRFSGDLRVLYQGSFFPKGNDQLNAVNFNAINTGPPVDPTSGFFLPTYDATQNRNQFILRGRLGMEADLSNGFTAGIRVATGQDNGPVSTNQTLGLPLNGGQGGNFSKYQLWLDRGYLNWTGFGNDISVSVGRFANPFWSPTDLVWYQYINFDGFALQAKHEVAEGYTPFAVVGAAPVFNTAFNASINLDTTGTGQPTQLPSHDKWLFGGQVGIDAKFNADYDLRVAAAFYDFTNVQGQASSPCFVQSSADVCDTDLTRPSFSQKGNTYFPLRNIVQTAANNFGQGPGLFEYFGLASPFRPAVASAQLDLGHFNPTHIIIDGEYVINTAFNRGQLSAMAANGLLFSNTVGPVGAQSFSGGNQGWMGRVTVGDKEIKHLWDWNVYGAYKYLESDAMIDAFVDSEFGLGGTNLKGYIVGGRLGVGENVWASLKWMSANNVSGAPFAVDIIMLDLNARF